MPHDLCFLFEIALYFRAKYKFLGIFLDKRPSLRYNLYNCAYFVLFSGISK